MLRLLVARNHTLGGVIEINEMYFGGAPRSDPDKPRSGRGRKGQPRTTKTPAMVVVQRPAGSEPGTPAGEARACVRCSRPVPERDSGCWRRACPRRPI